MPLSKIQPTLTTHPLTTPFIPQPTDHLSPAPPELLLTIISHLPPSSLLPLSQTSKYLHSFLHTHAASICNTAITTQYSHASSILRSQYSSYGWLLPTHPAILNEERRILRDKILFSSCKCPPCKQVLQTSSSSDLSLSELENIQGEGRLNCLSAFRPTSCKARRDIDGALRLSRPGPQYLVFLEKYSWEIVTRHSMSAFSHSSSNQGGSQDSTAAPSPTGTSNNDVQDAGNVDGEAGEGGETEEQEEAMRQEREKEEAMFEFMVGNYCVRRFLEAAEKALSSFSAVTSTYSREPSTMSTPQSRINKLRRKLRKRMARRERVEISEVVEEVIPDRPENERQNNPVSVETTPRRMMFGEISPASDTQDEKALLVKDRKGASERWEDGLLWYYSRSLNSEDDEKEGEEEMDEKVERRDRGCIAVVKNGFGILSRRVGRLVGSWRCLGGGIKGFRALEG